MRSLLLRLALFGLPLIVLWSFPLFVFLKSGEFVGLNKVIAQQMGKRSVVFGRVYTNSQHDREYKWRAINKRRPKVVLIGTSRMLGFRSDFFRNSKEVYNAGRGVADWSHLNEWVKNWPADYQPDMIILGLDQNLFFQPLASDVSYGSADSTLVSFFKHGWRQLYQDYVKRKFTLTQLFQEYSEVRIGLNAVANGKGFRNDGSYAYGGYYERLGETQHLMGMKEGAENLSIENCLLKYYGAEVRESALVELAGFVKTVRERGVKLVAFLPSYAPSIYDKIEENGGACLARAKELNAAAGSLFESNQVPWFDLSDGGAVGIRDREMLDGGHASEKASLRELLVLTKGAPELSLIVDEAAITAMLRQASSSPFSVVEN